MVVQDPVEVDEEMTGLDRMGQPPKILTTSSNREVQDLSVHHVVVALTGNVVGDNGEAEVVVASRQEIRGRISKTAMHLILDHV